MRSESDSLFVLIEQLKRRASEYLDLFTARTEDEFEAAFDVLLDKAVRHLEKNKVNFQTLGEEGLSAVLAGSLSIPGLAVTQESHSNGHVDVLIEAYLCVPARTKLGEAKIYDGPAYHVQGLGQLLGRYSTGREGRGLVISYVRKKDIKALVDKLRVQLDKDLPLGQTGPTRDHFLKWSFLTTHAHGSGEELHVGHVGCNLHVSGADQG